MAKASAVPVIAVVAAATSIALANAKGFLATCEEPIFAIESRLANLSVPLELVEVLLGIAAFVLAWFSMFDLSVFKIPLSLDTAGFTSRSIALPFLNTVGSVNFSGVNGIW